MDNKKNPFTQIAFTDRFLLLLSLFVVLACGLSRLYSLPVVDDAMITFRYSWNLVHRGQFVFNPDSWVLGTTTPLYAFVGALAILIGIEPYVISSLLEVLSVSFFVISVFRLLNRHDLGLAALVYIVVFFHNPFLFMPLSGMETGLFTGLICGGCLALGNRKYVWATTIACIAAFTRPEGFLLLGICVLYLLRNRESINWKAPEVGFAAFAGFLLIGWLILATYIYGSPLPNSMGVKREAGMSIPFASTFVAAYSWHQLFPYDYFFSFWPFLGLLGLVVMLFHRALRFFAIYFLAYMLFMLVGSAPDTHWYAFPPDMIKFVAIAVGMGWLMGTLVVVFRGRKFVGLVVGQHHQALGVVAGLLVLFSAPGYVLAQYRIALRQAMDRSPYLNCKHYEKAAVYLRQHADPSDVVYSPEIGYLGYLTRRYVYDPVGLVTRDPERQESIPDIWERAVDVSADWVVFSHMHTEPWVFPRSFLVAYEPQEHWVDESFLCVVFQPRTRPLPESDSLYLEFRLKDGAYAITPLTQ